MGKAKFVIVAAIILFVQTGSAQSAHNVGSPVQIKNVSAADDCDWPMFGRTPDNNRVAPDGCGPKNDILVIQWSLQTKGTATSAPILYNESLYYASWDNKLYCIGALKGDVVWSYDFGDANIFTTSPIAENGKVFIDSSLDYFYCIDALTGGLIWKYDKEYASLTSNMLVVGNRLYLCFSSQSLPNYVNPYLACVDCDTGKLIWKFEFDAGNNAYGIAISGDRIISQHGKITCHDINNGNIVWENHPKDSTLAVPIIVGNNIFVNTQSGLCCINETTGDLLWTHYPKADHQDWSTNNSASPVFYNQRAYYYCTDGTFYCVRGDDGKIVWGQKLDVYNSSPAISNNRLYVCTGRSIVSLNPDTGATLWQQKTTDVYDASPAIGYGKVYLISQDRLIYCFSDHEEQKPSLINVFNNKIIDYCQSLHLSAKVFDQNNNEIKDPELEWSVDPAFGTIDSTGLFKPSKTGVATITCRCGDAVATVDINVVDYLVPSVKTLVLSNVKPYQDYKTTLTYTNNSDARLDVKLTSTTDLVTLSPTSFSVDAGKTFDILVSCKLKEFVPSAVTSFTINADYGGCPDILHGTIMNADKYDCFKVSPEMLDFGLVKRGDSKTLALTIESNAKQILAISCDQPWVEISKKSLSVDVGQKETIDFKIMASSLPASSKLTANITIISDMNFCEQTTIPLLVSTEDSITIKLQVDSRNATINGQERMLDVPARIIAGRTMVPLRFISESFGCSILWDPVTQKIGIVRYDITVNLWIGKDFVEVNGNKLKIDAPPVIVGGRTMVPLRFIAEPFGAKVDWNAQTKEITITWPK